MALSFHILLPYHDFTCCFMSTGKFPNRIATAASLNSDNHISCDARARDCRSALLGGGSHSGGMLGISLPALPPARTMNCVSVKLFTVRQPDEQVLLMYWLTKLDIGLYKKIAPLLAPIFLMVEISLSMISRLTKQNLLVPRSCLVARALSCLKQFLARDKNWQAFSLSYLPINLAQNIKNQIKYHTLIALTRLGILNAKN